jgi:hypothetical protein
MDQSVTAAMAKWPNVPDVYGWLSLSERGEWRLHPAGDALAFPPDDDDTEGCWWREAHGGVSIASRQILRFMNRNYASDDTGRWYFQNGPQRVFVRLDAAPFIFHTTVRAAGGGYGLCAHTGRAARHVLCWWLDDHGKLYAETDIGAGLIAGRDVQSLLEALSTPDGGSALAAVEAAMDQEPARRQLLLINPTGKQPCQIDRASSGSVLPGTVPLRFCNARDVAHKLGFVRYPLPFRKPDPRP